jgi:hypothetical protein
MIHHPHGNLLSAKRLKGDGSRSRRIAVAVGIGVLLVAGALAAVTVPFWLIGERVYAHASNGRDALLDAQRAAEGLDLDRAIERSRFAQAEFGIAKEHLVKLEPLIALPYLGPNLHAADRLLVTGSRTASAVEDVLLSVRDILGVVGEVEALPGLLSGHLPDASTLFRDLTPERKRAMLAAFATSAPRMKDAVGKIDEALVAIDDVAAEDVSPAFTAPLLPMRAKLAELRSSLEKALPYVEVLPSALGYPNGKYYLLFFQNNTELRPSGGFLGVYGLVRVQDAELVSVTTNDVYALDGPSESAPRPAPPEPIRRYIGIDKWYLRDANWSPDFGVSAALMEQFFAEESAVVYGAANVPAIHGIVAITPKVAEDVLRLVGPVTVEGKTFTPENVVDQLEFEVERGFAQQGVPFHERKAIVGVLVREIIDRLSALSFGELLGALDIVERNLEEEHILLAAKDPAAQALIRENGWGGRLKPATGDYVMVVDANLASLKSDPAVHRTIAYSVEPGPDGSYLGKVAITYDHRGRFDWKTTRYRTYTRLYVPDGAQFLGASGALVNDRLKDPAQRPGEVDVGKELGKTVFGAFTSIEPGQKRTLEFRYKLPSYVVQSIRAGEYALDVEKQPGTLGHGLTLDLDFGKTLASAEPPEERAEWGDGRYRVRTDLRIDRSFLVELGD